MHWVTDERLRSRCGNCFTHAFTASNKPLWLISVLAISQHLLFFTVKYWACFRDSNYVCFRHLSKWWSLGGLPWILTFFRIQPVIITLLVAGLSLLSPCLHTHAVHYPCSCKTALFPLWQQNRHFAAWQGVLLTWTDSHGFRQQPHGNGMRRPPPQCWWNHRTGMARRCRNTWTLGKHQPQEPLLSLLLNFAFDLSWVLLNI